MTQGFTGGKNIVEYFDFTARILGFNTVKGTIATGLVPWTAKEQQKIDRDLTALSKRFYAKLANPDKPVPSWFMLIGFRMGRTTMLQELDDSSVDYRYYAEKGWLTSDYFYPIRLGPLKKAGGMLFDRMTPTIRKLIA